jgi:hypothetical protein
MRRVLPRLQLARRQHAAHRTAADAQKKKGQSLQARGHLLTLGIPSQAAASRGRQAGGDVWQQGEEQGLGEGLEVAAQHARVEGSQPAALVS